MRGSTLDVLAEGRKQRLSFGSLYERQTAIEDGDRWFFARTVAERTLRDECATNARDNADEAYDPRLERGRINFVL